MLEEFNKSIDVVYKKTKANITICYHNHLCNILDFMKDFYPILERRMLEDVADIFPGICKRIDKDFTKIEQMIFSGLLVCERSNKYYAFDLSKVPSRSPSDSISEAESAFGSRDGFVENIKDNIALIRTRVRDNNLDINELSIGRRSKTNVSILSINDIHNKDIKKEVTKMLEKIDIDAILSIDDITAYIQGNNIFPVYQYVGSPDLASRKLYNGEILILIDRVSNVLSLPTTIALTSRMTIDNINIPLFSIFERGFVIISFIISTMFLGVLSAFATWQIDSLSLNVLSILKVTQSGVIFPIIIEILAVLVLFELYYFIGFRQSRLTVSSTVVLIGGLIIGENLVTSGVAGILLMTFTAITYLLSFIVSSNVTVIAAISIIRLGILLSSYYFGIFGVTIAMILCFALFLKQKSFGVSFFYPFIPFDLEGLKQFFIASSSLKNDKRAKNLKVNNETRRVDKK